MSDGIPTPRAHDGMAIVREKNQRVTLIRNHEIRGRSVSFGDPSITYDPAAGGGTTTIVFNVRERRWETAFASIAGTSTNCAGGPTQGDGWLTCEETLDEYDKTHGWVFEVRASRPTNPEPIVDMGRFVHEAVALDRGTGIVYETEDRGTSGFYRFIPNDRNGFHAGGQLQMLKVVGIHKADLRGSVGVGSVFPVEWMDIAHPERAHTPGTTDSLGVFRQGLDQGGATFARLEGAWFGYKNSRIYFTSTSGGAAGEGQVWEYYPRDQQLRLVFEPTDEQILDNPDNITVSRQGDILLCEDGDLTGQRLIGLTTSGEVFPFAANNIILNGEKNGFTGDFRGFEWAGAVFSAEGKWLFANIQTPGVTFAITGPWHYTRS